MEFPVVFMVGMEEDVLPFAGPPAPADLEEERRLLYVGMTRARSRLYLSHATRRTVFGRKTCGRPSRFLNDIEEALKELSTPATLAGGRRRPPEQKSLFESG
jgi:DNA helicase-2/ATP-dependent DNA helicase PcrA